MATFHYQALDADGRLVTGELDADSVQQAAAQLEERCLSVRSIGHAASPSTAQGDELHAPMRQRPGTTATSTPSGESVEQAVLRSHMITILERGRAIAPALRAYAEELPTGRQRRQLFAVCRILERGDAREATTALAELPEFWIPLLSAATSSPDPGHVLNEFLNESQRTGDLRQQWWLAVAYPFVLVGIAAIVMTALSIIVIPEFRAIFTEFGIELPTFTLWMLTISSWLARWGVLLIVALLIAFVMLLVKASRRTPPSTIAWLGDRLRLPFGRRTAVARFARFSADLLEAGVRLPDALRIAGFTVGRSRLQRAAWRLANDIESTGQFSPRSYQRPLTAAIVYALNFESPPTTRVRLLREISTCHAERVRSGLSWTSGIVEPIAICLVGIVVGGTVLALFIPLIKLVEGLSK